MIKEEKILSVENYFTELKKTDESIIQDGIINLAKYNESSIKLLWVLKEPHCVNGGGWDMREFLSDPLNLTHRTDDFKWKKTYKLLMLCSWGILKDFQSWEKSLEDWNTIGSEKMLEVLNSIAYINLKKTPGAEKSIPSQIQKGFHANKELILLQIKAYEPDIIICGGTFHFMRSIMEESGVLAEKKFIKAYHPNQKSIKHKNYYDSVLIDVQKVSNG